MGSLGGGGNYVRVLSRPEDDIDELVALGTEVITGDICDELSLGRLLSRADGATLIHLAGVIHPRHRTSEFMRVNVYGTRKIVEAAARAGVKRAIVMSSNSPIGASKNPFELFDERSSYRPYMGYGKSKHLMEEWLNARVVASLPPEVVIVRAPWFYGPSQPARQTRLFRLIRQGRFPLFGRGEARRSLGYVDSLAYGILLASDARQAAGGTYWLADERPYSMFEIVETVRAVLREDFHLRVNPKIIRLPRMIPDIARAGDRILQSVHLYNQSIHVLSEMNLTIACAITKAVREIGYRPLVDLREGMRRSVEWCLSNGISM